LKGLKSVNEALFGWGSPVAMGAIRMVTGTLALINFLMISIDFEAWFTEKGFIPVWHAQKWAEPIPRLNLLANVTDSRVTAFVYGLCLLACFLTAIGLWTRVSTIAMFVLITTLHHRAPDILHSGDTLMRQMAFLIMLAPSGRACSVDRLIALWKGRAPAVPADVSLWPQRLMQFQVTVVYFTTVWHKFNGSHWRDGTATWFVPQLHEFDRFPVPAFFDQQPMVAITTYATLLIELGVGVLAYSRPLRKWVLLAGVLLHAGIEYRFNIPLFSFMMTSTYLAFYDGGEVSAWAKRLGDRLKFLKVRAFLPKGRQLTEEGAATLEAFDALGLVRYDLGTGDQWSAERNGRAVKNPYRTVLASSLGAWGLALVPGAWRRIMDRATTGPVESKSAEISAEAVNS
jgi:hypothetical protein